MTDVASRDSAIGDYLAAHGGPFYEMQLRLGLLHEHALRAVHRAAIFVALAFGAPLLLSLIEGHAWGPASDHPYLQDFSVWARFLVAIALFVLVERQVETKLRATLRQFVAAPILAPSSFEKAAAAVTTTLRRRDSRLAEIICLVLAIFASLFSLWNALAAGQSTWAIQGSEGQRALTLAAWWCIVVSNPIFWFLFLRGLWRHVVWSMLLNRLAKLDFRLVATHPDGKGGLSFLGQYPNAYSMYVLGISCVVGAALAHQLMDGELKTSTYGYVIAVWLFIVLAMFAIPLGAFSKPLGILKHKTLLASGARATQFHRLAERKVFGENIVAPDPAEAAEQTDIGDPSKIYDTTRKLSIFLVSRAALVPVAGAAVLPLAAAGLTMLPYKEMLSIAKKLLLL